MLTFLTSGGVISGLIILLHCMKRKRVIERKATTKRTQVVGRKESRYRECYCDYKQCNGKKRQKRTADAHAAKDEEIRQERIVERAAANIANAPIEVDEQQEINEQMVAAVEVVADGVLPAVQDNDASWLYAYFNPIEELEGWDAPCTGDGKHTLAHSVYRLLDWMTAKKVSRAAAEGAWDFGCFMRGKPEGDMPALPKYSKIEALVKKHREETTMKIDCCVDMCVAFWNPAHPKLQHPEFQNADKQACPRCKEPRFIEDPKTGKKVARRSFTYLPFKFWQQDLYAKSDLMQDAANDRCPSTYPDGHIRRSDGYRHKVLDNPNISADRRKRGLIMSSDGVPYFDENGSVGGWPVILMDAALPNGEGLTTAHSHMVALVPSTYKSHDDAENPTRIVTRKRYAHITYARAYIHIHVHVLHVIYYI
jgi:hypothetical protein